MRILYLAHRLPYPPNRGDRIRSYHTIKYLAQHALVDLACFSDEPVDDVALSKLLELCDRLTVVDSGGTTLRTLEQRGAPAPGLLDRVAATMSQAERNLPLAARCYVAIGGDPGSVVLPSDSPLVREMRVTGEWTITYRDSEATVLVRDGALPVDGAT